MSSIQVGAREFRDGMRAKPSSYSILMAKTSVEELVTALNKRFKVENWQNNIELKGSLGDLPGVAIVKFKDNPWVVAYWSVKRYLDIKWECRDIGQKLDTKVLNLWEKDTSGYSEWVFWQKDADEEVEACERMHDDEPYLRSRLRKLPKLKNLQGEGLREELFQLFEAQAIAQGIYIPGLDLDLSNPIIERVDLLTLPAKPLGMLDFQKLLHQGHPEYSILAIQAPIDLVSPEIAAYCQVSEWRKNLQSNSQIWDLTSADKRYWMPIVQPRNNDWTVVYWGLGRWREMTAITEKLSKSLDTKVMSLGEHDTSGAIGYRLLACGKQLEEMEGCAGEDIYFESELREEPEFDDFERDEFDNMSGYIDDRFAEEGIYIPSPELSVSDEWIGRVDLILQS